MRDVAIVAVWLESVPPHAWGISATLGLWALRDQVDAEARRMIADPGFTGSASVVLSQYPLAYQAIDARLSTGADVVHRPRMTLPEPVAEQEGGILAASCKAHQQSVWGRAIQLGMERLHEQLREAYPDYAPWREAIGAGTDTDRLCEVYRHWGWEYPEATLTD